MLTSGIHFEVGGSPRPTTDEWSTYYAVLQEIFAAYSIVPGYYVIDSISGEGRFKQYGNSAYEARLSKGFADVDMIALASTPPHRKKPGYNWSALCNLTYIEGYGRLGLDLMIDDLRCPFGSDIFETSLEVLGKLKSWDFGWCMSRDRDYGIQFYLSGGGGGDGIDREDSRRIDLWYACYQPEERRQRVRDIFPYNMISQTHLAHRLSDGRSLREFIAVDTDSELRPLTDSLWLWKVQQDRTEVVREKLLGRGIVIAE